VIDHKAYTNANFNSNDDSNLVKVKDLVKVYNDGIAACNGNACSYRLGAEWMNQRIERDRDPRLRKRVDDRRIAAGWRDFPEHTGCILDQINAFRDSLPTLLGQEAAA